LGEHPKKLRSQQKNQEKIRIFMSLKKRIFLPIYNSIEKSKKTGFEFTIFKALNLRIF